MAMELSMKTNDEAEHQRMLPTHVRMITGMLSEFNDAHMLKVMSQVLYNRGREIQQRAGDAAAASREAITFFDLSKQFERFVERIEEKKRKVKT